MQCNKAVIWWLVNDKTHPLVTEKDQVIENLMPLVSKLFPGINYFSISGFHNIMHTCVIPVLKKRFFELQSVSPEAITAEDKVDIEEFLPSAGYEWQDSSEWQAKFSQLLSGA